MNLHINSNLLQKRVSLVRTEKCTNYLSLSMLSNLSASVVWVFGISFGKFSNIMPEMFLLPPFFLSPSGLPVRYMSHISK